MEREGINNLLYMTNIILRTAVIRTVVMITFDITVSLKSPHDMPEQIQME
jgi:hypothetical protein